MKSQPTKKRIVHRHAVQFPYCQLFLLNLQIAALDCFLISDHRGADFAFIFHDVANSLAYLPHFSLVQQLANNEIPFRSILFDQSRIKLCSRHFGKEQKK